MSRTPEFLRSRRPIWDGMEEVIFGVGGYAQFLEKSRPPPDHNAIPCGSLEAYPIQGSLRAPNTGLVASTTRKEDNMAPMLILRSNRREIARYRRPIPVAAPTVSISSRQDLQDNMDLCGKAPLAEARTSTFPTDHGATSVFVTGSSSPSPTFPLRALAATESKGERK
ncbi:hypothetical protein BDV93DRAFT_565501 [Ceratobasidium sp. AG-I]|nr:hypothetical protein BDV93DRAFT_565501 [Ceratobasidium sp. AG-I]